MQNILILTLTEITIKGRNKAHFLKVIENTIKSKLNKFKFNLEFQQVRFLLELDNNDETNEVIEILKDIIGISWIYTGYKVDQTEENIISAVFKLIDEFNPKTYRLTSRVYFKDRWKSSEELISLVAQKIKEKYSLKVELEKFDLEINLKIFSKSNVLIYTKSSPAREGLPAGSTGKGLVLLSGGIDSPVASFLMQSRGLNNDFITFLTPVTSTQETLNKIKLLANQLNKFNTKNGNLYVVNFAPLQSAIKEHSYENYRIVLLRRGFVRFATKLAKANNIDALITGDALAQVASQTLAAQNIINKTNDFLIFKPLIGLNKNEIVNKAKAISTYEISILRGEDTCQLFAPKDPVINPKLEKVLFLEERIQNYEEILENIFQNNTVKIELGD